jgi:hypothetical protein
MDVHASESMNAEHVADKATQATLSTTHKLLLILVRIARVSQSRLYRQRCR